jgi:hypothetical protein
MSATTAPQIIVAMERRQQRMACLDSYGLKVGMRVSNSRTTNTTRGAIRSCTRAALPGVL